jgi:hypothetical protein
MKLFSWNICIAAMLHFSESVCMCIHLYVVMLFVGNLCHGEEYEIHLMKLGTVKRRTVLYVCVVLQK